MELLQIPSTRFWIYNALLKNFLNMKTLEHFSLCDCYWLEVLRDNLLC